MPAPNANLVTMQNRISLADAGGLVNKSPSAIFRWIRDGVRGQRLDHIRLGRSIFTSESAIEDFGRRVAAGRTTPHKGAATAGRDHVTDAQD